MGAQVSKALGEFGAAHAALKEALSAFVAAQDDAEASQAAFDLGRADEATRLAVRGVIIAVMAEKEDLS